jgi:hypothetical protein
VLVLGYNPYVTNMREGLHPFYPVLGPNRIDVMAENTPPILLNHGYNRVEKFLISFFSQTESHTANPTRMKIPFTVSRQELKSLSLPDSRTGGWGVLFSGVLLGSLALFLMVRGWRNNAPILMILALIAVTGFINPECWWARYAPQIGLLPVFLLLPGLQERARAPRIAAKALCTLLLVNNLLFAGAAVAASLVKSEKLDKRLAAVALAGGQGEYWAYRNPGDHQPIHWDQFSGSKGIVICGQLDSPLRGRPAGGFPLWLNVRNETDVTLFKGACASGPPF